MRLIEAYVNTLTKNYARFSGRMSRSEYWWFVLGNVVVNVAILVFGGLLLGGKAMVAIYVIYSLAIFLPNLSAMVRRLHDINLSGWWLLLFLIPGIGSIIVLIMLILPANMSGARWGDYYDSRP